MPKGRNIKEGDTGDADDCRKHVCSCGYGLVDLRHNLISGTPHSWPITPPSSGVLSRRVGRRSSAGTRNKRRAA